jgi:hypothetical protein
LKKKNSQLKISSMFTIDGQYVKIWSVYITLRFIPVPCACLHVNWKFSLNFNALALLTFFFFFFFFAACNTDTGVVRNLRSHRNGPDCPIRPKPERFHAGHDEQNQPGNG